MNKAHTLRSVRARVLPVQLTFIPSAPALQHRRYSKTMAQVMGSVTMEHLNAGARCLLLPKLYESWIRINCNCYVRGDSLLTQIHLGKNEFL